MLKLCAIFSSSYRGPSHFPSEYTIVLGKVFRSVSFSC